MSEPIRAMFAMADEVVDHGDYVVRTGKFFECDTVFTDMNGKQFSITEAEADANLPKFSGGPINIEHAPSFLDGCLGMVQRAWRNGKDILAEYRIPKDLHNLTKGKPIKTSSEWNVAEKMPIGAGLVVNPAVSDAIMMAAFAKAAPMQQMHDLAVESGAECAGKALFGTEAKFITPALLKAIQHVHDHTTTNGASCDLSATRKSMYGYYRAQTEPEVPAKEKKLMSKDEFKALFAEMFGLKQPEPADAATGTSAEIVQLKAEIHAEKTAREAAETARFAEAKAAQLTQDKDWIKKQIAAFKILPALEEKYVTLATENPAAFALTKPLIEDAPAIPGVAPATPGGNGAAFRAAATGSGDGDQLVTMATERMKDTKENFAVAFSAVCKENPALAEAHRAHGAGAQGGN